MENILKKLKTINTKAAAERKKRANRKVKKKSVNKAKALALPKVPRVKVKSNYLNPVTLNSVPPNLIVYEVSNRITGRKNYYKSNTFWHLMGSRKNNYGLLMADPSKVLFRNPVTRGNVKARNVQRVRISKAKTPSKSAAARKIQSAVRKHLKKKKAVKK